MFAEDAFVFLAPPSVGVGLRLKFAQPGNVIFGQSVLKRALDNEVPVPVVRKKRRIFFCRDISDGGLFAVRRDDPHLTVFPVTPVKTFLAIKRRLVLYR